MKITGWPHIFKNSLHILNKIQDAGFEAYFVGGSVRDYLLKLPIHDVDIATSAYPDEIKKIFHKTIDTGIEHGTVTVMDNGNSYEITTFRTESGYQDFRRPNKVTFVRALKDDLQRRDFTINALAIAPDGEIIDEFDGLDDLKSRTIKAVGIAYDRFHEDALRMMRAVRFQSQLNFKIEENTEKAISENAELLSKISVERINTEFVKMMLSNNWKIGFETFLNTQLFKYCPDFKNKNDFLKKMLSLKDINFISNESIWCTFVEILEIKDSNAFLTDWKESNQIKKMVININLLVNDIINGDYNIWDFYNVGSQYINDIENICELRDIELDKEKFNAVYANLPITSKSQLNIDGKYLIKKLDIKPGPQIGEILKNIERMVVYNKLENNKSKLIEYAKSLI